MRYPVRYPTAYPDTFPDTLPGQVRPKFCNARYEQRVWMWWTSSLDEMTSGQVCENAAKSFLKTEDICFDDQVFYIYVCIFAHYNHDNMKQNKLTLE